MPAVVSARILLGIALVLVAWQSLVPVDDVLVQTTWDKFAHGLVFVVLGLIAAFALRRNRPGFALLGLVLFGLMLEIAQGLSGVRSFEWLDLGADALGAWLGLLFGLGIRMRLATRA